MKVLISISYASSWQCGQRTVDGDEFDFIKRRCDWGKRGVRKYLHHLAEALRVLSLARNYDALILCTVSFEAFVAGLFRPLICPRTRLLCFDILMPRDSKLVRRLAPLLRRLDKLLVIRTGDIETLNRRFGVPANRCDFVAFPADPLVPQATEPEADYIYSSGWAHRDWPTLISALASLPYRAIISTGAQVDIPPAARDRIQLLPMVSPEEGRKLMARAKVVVISMLPTDLPSGPLVLLDAMMMGKAIVVSDVNGTRDYVAADEVALVVEPEDVTEMANAIEKSMRDEQLRARLGQAARSAAAAKYSPQNFLSAVRHSTLRLRNASIGAPSLSPLVN